LTSAISAASASELWGAGLVQETSTRNSKDKKSIFFMRVI